MQLTRAYTHMSLSAGVVSLLLLLLNSRTNGFVQPPLSPTRSTSSASLAIITGNPSPWGITRQTSTAPLQAFKLIVLNDDDGDNEEEEEEDDDEEEEEEDPYTQTASSEFQDDKESNSLSTLGGSNLDWGGALGQLRKRVEDVETGKSQDPSNALFRLMSAKTPNELIGTFVQTANPKVVQACSDAVQSLLGGLSSPQMGIETIVKANGEKIGNLCFQLQMTGYLFRNVEYVLALKEMMELPGSATLQDYKDAFDRLDVDDSGYIEKGEVQKLLDDIYEETAPKFEVDAFLQFFDKNQDGKISWSEFEQGLMGAVAAKAKSQAPQLPTASDEDDEEEDDDDEEADPIEYEVSGKVEVELESGETITVEAREYINSLKREAEALKAALRREQEGSLPVKNNGNLVGSAASPKASDFGGIAQYIASRQGDINALTEGIQPEIVDTMKRLVDFVLEGGDSGKKAPKIPREEMEMELPGSALQQLALWQLILGYRLREAEATGEYLELLE